ncbi:MAG: hypothetical protein IJK49_04745 [Prevotella sp.]|nr:hypothetical protein [Prevotella sp.]
MKLETFKDILIFIIGLFAYVKIRFLGTFALSEIIILVFTPLIPIFLYRTNRDVRRFIHFACLWLLGVIISNIWNEISYTENIKGIFNVALLILIIPFIYWILYDKPQRWLYYFIGYSLSHLYNFYYQQSFDSIFDYETWRVYAYYPLFIFIASLFYYIGRKKISYLIIGAFGVWSLFNNSRNIFLSQSLAIFILIYISRFKGHPNSFKQYFKRNQILLLLFFVAGLFSISQTYENLANNKVLGERAYKKYIMQKNSERGLASGRSDFFESLYLVSKNPAIGYGSYAKDKNRTAYNYRKQYNKHSKYESTDILPGHSYILGAWVYSGILGFIFFAFVLYLMLKSFISGAALYDRRMTGIYIYVTFMFLWDILFSPFQNRINLVFYIITIILLMTLNNERYLKNEYN